MLDCYRRHVPTPRNIRPTLLGRRERIVHHTASVSAQVRMRRPLPPSLQGDGRRRRRLQNLVQQIPQLVELGL